MWWIIGYLVLGFITLVAGRVIQDWAEVNKFDRIPDGALLMVWPLVLVFAIIITILAGASTLADFCTEWIQKQIENKRDK